MWYRLHVSEINIKIYDIIINMSQSITVGTISKSNILNDIEQLLEHTEVSKHSIGFKWRNRGCIVCFYKTIIFTVHRSQYYFQVLLLNYTAHLLLHNVVLSTPRLSGIRAHSFFLKYCSLVIKQKSLNQRMKLIINKLIYAFSISTPFVLLYFCSRAKRRADNNFNRNRVIVFIIISNTFTLKQVGNMHY
jgi:hypothetical protein